MQQFHSILKPKSSILIMGILNVTPDSFSEVGKVQSISTALRHVEQMINDGVDIIDIGGEPTNPSVHPVITLQEELDRVLPVIEVIKKEFTIPLSVDTSKPEVMQAAINKGVNFINDVRALRNEKAMQIVAKANLPVCLMHMEFPDGKINLTTNDANSTKENNKKDIVDEVKKFLKERVAICLNAGIAPHNIFIDPGFGAGNFGKSLQQNLQLLNRLNEFLELGYPILVGLSRKTFLGELLNLPVNERLYGSLAAAVLAVTKGAKIIRTHDVKPTVEALKVTLATYRSAQPSQSDRF